jgi:hypothetical protein
MYDALGFNLNFVSSTDLTLNPVVKEFNDDHFLYLSEHAFINQQSSFVARP